MYAQPKGLYDPSEGFSTASVSSAGQVGRLAFSRPKAGEDFTSNVIPLPTAAVPSVHSTLAVLRRFRRHAHNANPVSFKLAEEFLGLASGARRSFRFSAQVFADGNAVIGIRSDNIDAQFEFFPDGVIAANIDIGEDEWDEDVEHFDGRTMPASIAEKLGISARP
ncbi:hypothetical protein LOK46_13375 [Methylobacterium sp. NMS14P]|uniref:hypothetical protein n=1 Tax=Methylobacterium sp. NMS14P TaxID=2894310 RepID=UPI0023589D35|nr:hypothetical protein [Methylobacterium sp. NMS14P]WCS27765.1 hypothetical protein LOK46_13375 [Methylobacterium sp. NMS14P]